MKAYSDDTGTTYDSWDDLVAAETHGYAVTVLITGRRGKTWPYSIGLFATKDEAERVRRRERARFRREQKRHGSPYAHQTYQWFIRPVWKVER